MVHLFERLFGTVAVSEGRIFYRFRWMSRLLFPSSAHLVAAGVSWPCVGMFSSRIRSFLPTLRPTKGKKFDLSLYIERMFETGSFCDSGFMSLLPAS